MSTSDPAKEKRDLSENAQPIKKSRSGSPKRKSAIVQSAANVLDVLDYLGTCHSGAGVTEIAKAIGVHKSTASRLLATMEPRGYVSRDANNGQFSLGMRLVELARTRLEQIDLLAHARPVLKELVARTGETAHLAIWDQGTLVYIDKVDTPQTLMMRSRIGYRVAIHCTALGKAVLSTLPHRRIESLLSEASLARFTSNTITDPATLKEHLCRIREKGFAIDDEENEEGIRCAAAPVMDVSGRVKAAISVSGPTMRVSRQKAEEIGNLVRDAAHRLSLSLGYSSSS